MSEEELSEEELEKLEVERVKQEKEKIKQLGLEDKSKDAFGVLTTLDKDKEEEHHKKLREKKFVGF